MADIATPPFVLAEAALRRFEDAGYTRVAPPILQPADIFLDLTGEDIRRRLFLTNGSDGPDLCLRPDFTIPVCRQHLETGPAGRQAAYCYAGPVFRQRPGALGEIPQIGAESIGRSDHEAADAGILALAVAALDDFGIGDVTIRIGDETLFTAILSGLDLPLAWQRRLRDLFGETDKLAAAVARMAGEGGSEDDGRGVRLGFLAALEGADPDAAQAVVEDLLSIAGISAVGGRTASEIAERFLEQAALASGSGAHRDAADILRRYLSISGAPDAALADLDGFVRASGIDLTGPIDAFRRRLEAIEAQGIATARMTFEASFGRRLDYYTGFVFEIHAARSPVPGQIVGGGRYDRLVKLLGAETEVPAVGFSMWLDRIGALSGTHV
ncbi:ATP phosphoribosyltransferase regulatory subunit [Polymorphum gilvum]|uniref:ATP phosphoribosyltransferase regulatory subunit n=1 Tax=Polymorphum gilvum (strain LMG 25793 / CGMCC 1.9160 / SL003B-26A1) TaxID=991905 RepID=F2J054_POLGS|nr:ATP phosphoribosyltransferase regulatory subunit [Polymorphum gilvum]ADZ71889.1 ATP phosphoribosyltransferase regulatory subunit [Polymorphum gilvum SL003B-26A1]